MTTNLPFVSYAQNFEDVMLWRALRDVERGFYIDVGAYSPRDESVTLAFYERGWCGINIEPNRDAWLRLEAERPRDINLDVAIGRKNSSATLLAFPGTGLSTLDPRVADQRVLEGWDMREDEVEVRRLASICGEHLPAGQEIHFLKVDVEGFEHEVLSSMDWTAWRPWIVVVEAMRPTTSEPAHDRWEALLVQAHYECVYADGLNRFYLAEEHSQLSHTFRFPPNVFDTFVRASEWDALHRASHAEAELACVYATRSWRWMRPFRKLAALWRKVHAEGNGEHGSRGGRDLACDRHRDHI